MIDQLAIYKILMINKCYKINICKNKNQIKQIKQVFSY